MFGRIQNLIIGFLSLFISGLERKNPEALLEAEKERVRKMISQYNEALAPQAGLVERLKRQIVQEENRERELKAKITAHITAGNQDVAGRLALEYQQVKRDLDENRAQLDTAETTYKNLVRTRDVVYKEAQLKIQQIASSISRMKMNEANAELTEMAAGMIGKIGEGGDSLNRLEAMVNETADNAAGRARVARDSMNTADVEMKESEQQALANQALADFAAENGIAMKGSATAEFTPAAPATEKTMGS
jgi:phage shock protein A